MALLQVFLVVLKKLKGEKLKLMEFFSKTQEIGKFNPKIVKKKPRIFFEKLTFSSKNSHFFEKLKDF